MIILHYNPQLVFNHWVALNSDLQQLTEVRTLKLISARTALDIVKQQYPNMRGISVQPAPRYMDQYLQALRAQDKHTAHQMSLDLLSQV